MSTLRRQLTLATCLVYLVGCASRPGPVTAIDEIRKTATGSNKVTDIEQWLVGELLAPGGTPAGVTKARTRLDAMHDDSARAHLTRGLDDSLHGRFRTAPEEFLKAAQAARVSTEADADLIAWYAVHSAIDLK